MSCLRKQSIRGYVSFLFSMYLIWGGGVSCLRKQSIRSYVSFLFSMYLIGGRGGGEEVQRKVRLTDLMAQQNNTRQIKFSKFRNIRQSLHISNTSHIF